LNTLLSTGDVEIMQVRENLFLIDSGGRKLVEVELALSHQENRENRMKDALKHLKGCDYVICDCPPSMNLINANVLSFCDEVIVPVSMDYLSQEGARQTMEVIDDMKWITKDLNIRYRILATFFDSRTRVSAMVLEEIRKQFDGRIYDTVVRVNTSLREAPGSKKTIYEHAPLSRGAFDYYKLTEEIMSSVEMADRNHSG
jgi:chromosome partitioning protein